MNSPAMKIRYVKSVKSIHGDYDVYANAVFVGAVFKWERHFNLRRSFTLKGWRAVTPDGTHVYTNDNYAHTRDEAARSLAYLAARAKHSE